MYCTFMLLAILLVIFLILTCSRWFLIRKVGTMTFYDKIQLLHNESEPFGFLYNYSEDILIASGDAWKRKWGHSSLCSEKALLFRMIFDCESVYFDYEGKTWLIELRKGQYGIAAGGEVGIYCAEKLVPHTERPHTVFFTAPDYTLPRVTFRLYEKQAPIFTSCGRNWWITGFRIGRFSHPANLRMPVCFTFPNDDMMQAFTDSLLDMGYSRCDLSVWQHSISFCYDVPKSSQYIQADSKKAHRIQKKNDALCKLYGLFTKPFEETLDKLIYLSLCCPSAFRRIVTMGTSMHYQKKRDGEGIHEY